VGRFASAFAFLVVLVVILGSAGCGQRFDELGNGSPPSEASFAADALAALEKAGSAHVVVDAQAGAISGTNTQVGIHFEGDVSTSALVGDLQLSFTGGTVGARVLANEHDVYVRFMGAWYHEDAGVADALDMAGQKNGELLSQLTTPASLGKLFTQFFEGEIAQGPDLGGSATWEFDGRLRAETFANLVEKYGGIELTDNDRALFEKVAATSHIRISLNSGLLPVVHPFFWAQYLASLDVMSGGRTIAGLALGWWEEDFRVGGAALKERGKRSDEALEIVTRLWRGQPIETAGTFWDARGLALNPRPSPRMPLWIGGGAKSIERAARYAEGLNPLHPSLEEIRTVLRPGLDAAAERLGRQRLTLAIFNYCVVIEPSDNPSWVRDELMPTLRARMHGQEPDDSIVWGSPEQCAERLRKLFAAGADYILFDGNLHGWLPEEFSEEQMSRFVERVVPLLH